MEAVASEVALLRRSFPHSVVWGVSRRDGLTLSWRRGFSVPPSFAVPFRLVSRVAQRAFHVNHIFGGLGDWFHLRSIGKRPTVLTIAVDSPLHDTSLLKRIDRFVVEWDGARQQLHDLGVSPERIDLILPPVDTDRFRPSPAPGGPFTVLFVSSPDSKEWLTARGVDLLLDVAALCRDMRFRLVWRPWGDSAAQVKNWINRRNLRNVELTVERVADMRCVYAEAHVTVAPFRDLEKCKPAPNSIAESLASGRPVVVSSQVGFAEMIAEAGAGLVCGEDATDFAAKLQDIRERWKQFAIMARTLAEERLAAPLFLNAYRRVYEVLL
jgi:glycosyltransferase involved in cell wall biosynthesis